MAVTITRYHVGENTTLRVTNAGTAAYQQQNRTSYRSWHLGEERREVTAGEVPYVQPTLTLGPFDRVDFGDRDRLSWTRGACSVPQEVPIVSWSQRYALWWHGAELGVLDATRGHVARTGLPVAIDRRDAALLTDGKAYFHARTDIVMVALEEIEALFARSSGTIAIQLRELYPHRLPRASLSCIVDDLSAESATLRALDATARLQIPRSPRLQRGMLVTLHDELMPNHYAEIQLPDRPRRPIDEVLLDRAMTCELVVETATDPAGHLATPSASARDGELDRMFGMLADEPDDEGARIVVVDLLEDAGEPYASIYARLLAGDDDAAVRTQALGTLASYIHDVEWHDNLPWAGVLAAAPPTDETIGNVVAADRRLGFFHTLRLGDGNFKVYSKLVGSPRAVGLRHVDGSRLQILTALIAAKRTQLRRLSSIKFATKEVLEALADPTFDNVVEIETETQTHLVDRLLEFIARDERKFFARAPRHLVLVERSLDAESLVASVLAAWDRLPLDKLTLGGVTIARDGTARADSSASVYMWDAIGARFRFEDD